MNIRILHTHVLEDPFGAILGLDKWIPESPPLQRNSDRLEAIEHLELLEKCKTEAEIESENKKKKLKKQALTLEMIGELPDADIKPPENVLFVCKLNPITE